MFEGWESVDYLVDEEVFVVGFHDVGCVLFEFYFVFVHFLIGHLTALPSIQPRSPILISNVHTSPTTRRSLEWYPSCCFVLS